MKIFLFLSIAVFLLTISSCAQTRTIDKTEYDKAFQFAVSKTNADYPFIFKVVTTSFENGKPVRIFSEARENEAAGRSRIKRSVAVDGRETSKYQLTVGSGNIFCSDDGTVWKSTKYECPAERPIYGNGEVGNIEYSVKEGSVDGKKVKIYREYSVYDSSGANKPKTFNEKVSTVDARGYFINIIDTEGTLDPKTVTLTREQSWTTQAKFAPVIAPVN